MRHTRTFCYKFLPRAYSWILIVVYIAGLGFPWRDCTQAESAYEDSPATSIDYSKWDRVLSEYVDSQGRVDYKDLLKNRRILDAFIENCLQTADMNNLSNEGRKAFWINAYNALTMRLILDNYPPKFGTIKSINWGRPWSVHFFVAGRELTLNQIEHDMLRKWEPIDPRIHFAVNCASIGCPKLPQKHFNPETLNQQLDYETRKFMSDLTKVRLDQKENILYYSEILKWFKDDFLSVSDSVLEYILRYVDDETKKYIERNESRLSLQTLKYDWGLNEQ